MPSCSWVERPARLELLVLPVVFILWLRPTRILADSRQQAAGSRQQTAGSK